MALVGGRPFAQSIIEHLFYIYGITPLSLCAVKAHLLVIHSYVISSSG